MEPKEALQIHQILHGYDRGHRALASSINLDDASQATMLVLSDLLTASDLAPGTSYLTGYPLQSASRYVLARTWGASRNYRPGSVWTHSLILEYSSLTLLTDLAALVSLFRDPSASSVSDYGQSVEISARANGCLDVEEGPRAAMALVQIYGSKPARNVKLPTVSKDADEALALAIWRQMWPAFRREFAFTTGGGDFPSEIDAECSLSFSDVTNGPLALCTRESLGTGFSHLLSDLKSSGPTPLRSFLSRYVIEGKHPRKLAVRLVTAQASMQKMPLSARLGEMQSLTTQERLPRLFRDVLSHELADSPTPQDLIALLKAFKNEPGEISLSNALFSYDNMSNDELSALLEATQPSRDGSFGRRLFEEIVLKTPMERLALIANGSTRVELIRHLPLLASLPEFWPDDDGDRARVMDEFAGIIEIDLDTGLQMFGTAVGARTLEVLLRRTRFVQSKDAPSLLFGHDLAVAATMRQWLVENPSQVEQFVLLGSSDRKIFDLLAEIQIEFRLPIIKPRIWCESMLQQYKNTGDKISNASAVIGYAAAMAVDSEISKNVATIVFDSLQEAAAQMRLSLAEETYLKLSVPQSSFSWSLSNTVTKSAVLKWPVQESDLGALTITQNRQHLLDILGEIIAKDGTRHLTRVIADPRLSAEAREAITKLLTPAKKNSLLFWWL